MPADWGCDGTTGYDFMDEVSALQHEPKAEPVLVQAWARLTGRPADFAIEEAARDLGATPFQAFRLITFPLIRPTIIGGMLLIFAQSFDMFVITFFNIGAQSTLPMVIWSMVRLGINPTLNALGAMVMGFSILVLVAAHRVGGVKLAG